MPLDFLNISLISLNEVFNKYIENIKTQLLGRERKYIISCFRCIDILRVIIIGKYS